MLALEDEFMVVACDGLWDMLSSQRCVEIARRHLRDHNDPVACAQFLVRILHQSPAMIDTCKPCKGAAFTVDLLGFLVLSHAFVQTPIEHLVGPASKRATAGSVSECLPTLCASRGR